MVEITKLGNKTVFVDGRLISLFRGGKFVRQMYYGGYEDFDGANGGTWVKYIHIPVKTPPYYESIVKIVIDSTNISVYNAYDELKSQAPIASEFWNYVRTDGRDIRFFDEKLNQLYFWIEKWDYNNKQAILWTKVNPDIMEVNIAFFNPLALESSFLNRDAMFIAYYDAEDDPVDAFPSGWELNDFNGSPDIRVSSARAYQGSKSIYGAQPTTGAPSHWYLSYPIVASKVLVVEYAVNVDGKLNSGTANEFLFGIGNDVFVNYNADIFIGRINFVYAGNSIRANGVTLTSLTFDVWYHVVQLFDFDNQRYKVVIDGTDYGWFDFEETATVDDINRFHWKDDNYAGYFDMLRVYLGDMVVNFDTPVILEF